MAKIDYAGTIANGDSTNLVAGSTGIDLTTGNLFISDGSTWRKNGSNYAINVSDGQVGIARARWIDVVSATSPTIAGSGTITFASPVVGVVIDSVMTAGVVPLTLTNWTIRYAVDAPNDGAAAILLPTTFPSGDPTAEGGQIGSFNVQPVYLGDTEGGGDARVGQIILPRPVKIDLSSGITRLDFAHNLGITIILGVRAVEVLS